jgi:hypothetical protein
LTNTSFSASSALGLLALMGVSVETAVILASYLLHAAQHSRFIPNRLGISVAVRTPQEENGAVFQLNLCSRPMCQQEGNPDP